MKKSLILNEKGAGLVMVLIVLLVLSILSTSAIVLATNNTKQVSIQDKGIDSYYIARSGAEVAFQALLTVEPSLLTPFSTTPSHTLESQIDFDEGRADVLVETFMEGTTRRMRITSIGVATGTGVSRSSILEFDYDGYGNLKWSR